MAGTTKAVRSRFQKEEATLVGTDRGHRLYSPPVVDDDALDGTTGEANRLARRHVGEGGNRTPGAVIGFQRRLLSEWLRHNRPVDDGAGHPGGSRQTGGPQEGTARDGPVRWWRFHLRPELPAEPVDEIATGKVGAWLSGAQGRRSLERLHLLGRSLESARPPVVDQLIHEGGDTIDGSLQCNTLSRT